MRWTRPTPLSIAGLYVAVAGAWIWRSDQLLELAVHDPAALTRLQTAKGIGFVLATGVGLFLLTRWAERALRREWDLVRGVVADVAEAILVLDRAGCVVTVNAAAATLLRTDAESLRGRTLADLFAPEAAARMTARLRHVLETGEPATSEEEWTPPLRVPRAPGADAAPLVRATTSPLRGADGRPRGAVCLARDVTAERAAERALRLREAAVRDGEKLEALGRLAGGVAHDFNNLLTVVRTSLDFARDGLPPDADGPREDIDAALAATGKAGELTRRLLAFSRHRPSARERVAVDAAVEDVVLLLRRIVPRGVSIEVRADGSAGAVDAEAASLAQVLMNLVLNAADATAAVGGGTITVECSAETLAAPAPDDAGRPEIARDLPPGRYAVVRVIDHGVGMDAETRAHAVEPFFTTKAERGGTGLGLATATAVARQYGGAVAITSAPGVGTTVTVYLPRLADAAGAVPAPTLAARSAAVPALAPPRAPSPAVVLLVDDEDEVRTLAGRALARAGHVVLPANDGAAALRLLERLAAPPDLLVTDVVMPVIGGVALAERLRERWPSVPVLFITAYTAGETVALPGAAEEPEGDAVAVLEKPFALEQLVAAAERLLARAEPAMAR